MTTPAKRPPLPCGRPLDPSALRRTRVFAAAGAAIGLALWSLGLTAPEAYEASSTFLLSAASTGTSSNDLASRGSLTQEAAQTYANIITAQQVLTPVIDSLGLSTTVAQLSEAVHVDVPYGTSVLHVTVTDRDAQRALSLSQSLSDHVPSALQDVTTRSAIRVVPLGTSSSAQSTQLWRSWPGAVVVSATGGVLAWYGARRWLERRAGLLLDADFYDTFSEFPVLGYVNSLDSSSRLRSATDLEDRLSAVGGPTVVLGGTRQVQAKVVADVVAEHETQILMKHPHSALPTDSRADDPCADRSISLVGGPTAPRWADANETLLQAAAAIVVIPARGAYIPDLIETFKTLGRSGVPVLGVALWNNPSLVAQRRYSPV